MLAWKLPVPTGVSMIGLKTVLNIAVYEYKVNLKMERSHKYTKYSAENTKVENHEILTRIIFAWKAKCLKKYFPIDCQYWDLPPPSYYLLAPEGFESLDISSWMSVRSEELGVRSEGSEEWGVWEWMQRISTVGGEILIFSSLWRDRATSGQERTNDNVLLHFKTEQIQPGFCKQLFQQWINMNTNGLPGPFLQTWHARPRTRLGTEKEEIPVLIT